MKAISIKHPWAWAIFHGKDVENRTWATKFRGDLLIHASLVIDYKGIGWIEKNFRDLLPADFKFTTGGIIGKVTMAGIVVHSSSPWFFGPYGHVYTDPIEFKEPIPFKGALKFFDVPDSLLEEQII